MIGKKVILRLINSPWQFKNHESLKEITLIDLNQKIINDLKLECEAKLKVLYSTLVDALWQNQISILRQNIEGNLMKNLNSSLNDLEKENLRFQKLDSQDPVVNFYNFEISFGVNIERSLNLPQKAYDFIGTLDKIKDLVSIDAVKNEAGEDFDQEMWENELKNLWMYLNMGAPANIVASVYASFESMPPLTLANNENDVIYKEKTPERHFIRFETEPIRLQSQYDAFIHGHFEKILKLFKENKNFLIEREWIITDIDHFMKGNPYIN